LPAEETRATAVIAAVGKRKSGKTHTRWARLVEELILAKPAGGSD
jgi:hypothetical protein